MSANIIIHSHLRDLIGTRDAAAHVPVVAVSNGQVAGAQKQEGYRQYSKGAAESHSLATNVTVTIQSAMCTGFY
jgi:hypothetical protein